MPVTQIDVRLPDAAGSVAARPSRPARTERESSFGNLVDAINPLHHVPGVGDVYRAATGDKISDGAKLAGHVGLGAAVGGPVGAIVGAGVFVVGKLFDAVFGGGGKKEEVPVTLRAEDQPAQAAMMAGGAPAATESAVRPGFSPEVAERPERSRSSAAQTETQTQPKLGGAPTQLSSAQFAALLSSFGQPAADPAENGNGDIAARMRANLDKYQTLKAAEAAR